MDNMKKIITLIALCMSVVGCDSTPQASPEQLSIQAVYSTDSKITSGSKTASEVVSKLQSVRLVGCPAPFVDSYNDYIRAWEKMVVLEKKMYTQNMKKASSDLASYISDYRSVESVVALKKEWPAFASEIDSVTAGITKAYTYFITVGARYNAVYPTSLF